MTGARVRRSAATLLEVVLGVAMVLTALFGVVRPVLGPTGIGVGTGPVFGVHPSVAATVDVTAVKVTTDPVFLGLESRGEIFPGDAVELYTPTGTTVGVYDLDLRQRLGLGGAELLKGLLTVGVLALLWLIVRTLRRGDPFIAANARRLYLIAAAIGLGGQTVELLAAWGRAAVLNHPEVAPYVLADVDVSFTPLLAGLGVAVAAEVFRQGTSLRAEVEGLV